MSQIIVIFPFELMNLLNSHRSTLQNGGSEGKHSGADLRSVAITKMMSQVNFPGKAHKKSL